MFGENYQWIHYVTSEVCGDSTFSREKGANKVTYSAVTTYKGESEFNPGHHLCVISGAAALYLGHADDCGIAQHFQLFVRGVVHSIHAEFRSNFCQLRPKDGGEQLSHQPQDLRCALHWDSQRCHRSGCPGCWCQIPICYQQSARPCLEYNRFSAECHNTVFYLQSSPKWQAATVSKLFYFSWWPVWPYNYQGCLFFIALHNFWPHKLYTNRDLNLNWFEALCFLIEVDNIIHASFLGESFEKRVTHRCEVITVSASAQGTWQPYVFFAVVLLLGLGSAPWIRVISPARNSYSIVKYSNSTAQGFIRIPSWHSSRAWVWYLNTQDQHGRWHANFLT